MWKYHKHLGIFCNGKFIPTGIYSRTNPILNVFIMRDEEMGHLKLLEVISNTLENLSLKAEAIMHTQRVCSLSSLPTPLHSFAFCGFFSLCLSLSFFFLPSLPPSSPSSFEYQPWMMRCMPTQSQIPTTKRNTYVLLIDNCTWDIHIFIIRNKLYRILQALCVLTKVFLSTRFIDEEHRAGKIEPPNRTCQNKDNANPWHLELQSGRKNTPNVL